MTRSLLRRQAGALVLAAATALAACGGDDANDGDNSAITPPQGTHDGSNVTPAGAAPSSTSAGTSPPAASTAAAPVPAAATTVAAVASTAAATSGVGVALIVENSADPYIAAMVRAAEAEAGMLGVSLVVTAVEADGDTATQIAAIDAAIARGDAGVLITPSGDEVATALEMARGAGLYPFALDHAPNPATAVDITFAVDHFAAGRMIGQWTAAQLGDQTARIAMLDFVVDQPAPVDYLRDQGFLTGMGIVDRIETTGNGKEPESGTHAGGGEYEIVCHQPTMGIADGGRTAMEACLAADPEVNVVYTFNEAVAQGAADAMTAVRGDLTDVIVVSVGGGCEPGLRLVGEGVIGATAQQYPSRMATLGMEAIKTLVDGGPPPAVTPGLDVVDTGVALVTDRPVAGLDSISLADARGMCWGP